MLSRDELQPMLLSGGSSLKLAWNIVGLRTLSCDQRVEHAVGACAAAPVTINARIGAATECFPRWKEASSRPLYSVPYEMLRRTDHISAYIRSTQPPSYMKFTLLVYLLDCQPNN